MVGRSARLEQDQLPQVVAVILQIDPLVEDGLARDVADPADDDLAALALGVAVDDLEDLVPAHHATGPAKIVRCQGLAATPVMSNITCLTTV